MIFFRKKTYNGGVDVDFVYRLSFSTLGKVKINFALLSTYSYLCKTKWDVSYQSISVVVVAASP